MNHDLDKMIEWLDGQIQTLNMRKDGGASTVREKFKPELELVKSIRDFLVSQQWRLVDDRIKDHRTYLVKEKYGVCAAQRYRRKTLTGEEYGFWQLHGGRLLKDVTHYMPYNIPIPPNPSEGE